MYETGTNFCLPKIRQALEIIQPKRVLVIGLTTYKILDRLLGDGHEETVYVDGKRVAIESTWQGRSVLATLHLTGCRLTPKEMDFLRERFFLWWEKELP